MKFRKIQNSTNESIIAKARTAVDALYESAYHLEQVADILYAKDADKALSLSRQIQMFMQNLRDGIDGIGR